MLLSVLGFIAGMKRLERSASKTISARPGPWRRLQKASSESSAICAMDRSIDELINLDEAASSFHIVSFTVSL